MSPSKSLSMGWPGHGDTPAEGTAARIQLSFEARGKRRRPGRVCCPTNLEQSSGSSHWRRERDSNPRNPSEFSGFQDHRLKPLGHLSVRRKSCRRTVPGREPETTARPDAILLGRRHASMFVFSCPHGAPKSGPQRFFCRSSSLANMLAAFLVIPFVARHLISRTSE